MLRCLYNRIPTIYFMVSNNLPPLGCMCIVTISTYLSVINFSLLLNCIATANFMAGGMTFIQALWLLILTRNKKKMEGKLLEVESLRCVFLDISKSLNRLGAAPPQESVIRQRKRDLTRSQESLIIGGQSFIAGGSYFPSTRR